MIMQGLGEWPHTKHGWQGICTRAIYLRGVERSLVVENVCVKIWETAIWGFCSS